MGERYTYTEDGMIPTPQGQWVKAYDYDFVRKSQIEMIEKLQARVRELEEQVKGMIPMPKVGVTQENAGHDYCFAVRVNNQAIISLDGHEMDESADGECRVIASRLTQALKGGE